jgi:hypothetical protein
MKGLARQSRQCETCITLARRRPESEAVLTLSVLVGAISMARAIDDPDLARHLLAGAAAALKQWILN